MSGVGGREVTVSSLLVLQRRKLVGDLCWFELLASNFTRFRDKTGAVSWLVRPQTKCRRGSLLPRNIVYGPRRYGREKLE